MESNFQQITQGLLITVLLGRYFTALQAFEYFEASFTLPTGGGVSTFYLATTFHGLYDPWVQKIFF